MPKNKLSTKRKSIEPSNSSGKENQKQGKINNVDISINYRFWRIFSIDLCRVETAIDSTPPSISSFAKDARMPAADDFFCNLKSQFLVAILDQQKTKTAQSGDLGFVWGKAFKNV